MKVKILLNMKLWTVLQWKAKQYQYDCFLVDLNWVPRFEVFYNESKGALFNANLIYYIIDINKKFSSRYYLTLVLIDEENRRYFKQQEITLYRRKSVYFFFFTLILYRIVTNIQCSGRRLFTWWEPRMIIIHIMGLAMICTTTNKKSLLQFIYSRSL